MHLVMALIPGAQAVATLGTCAAWATEGVATPSVMLNQFFLGIQILAIVRLSLTAAAIAVKKKSPAAIKCIACSA